MMCSIENTIYFASVNYALRFQESATSLITPSGQCQAYLPYGQEGVLVQAINVEGGAARWPMPSSALAAFWALAASIIQSPGPYSPMIPAWVGIAPTSSLLPDICCYLLLTPRVTRDTQARRQARVLRGVMPRLRAPYACNGSHAS
jgi:hypothetical protein